MKPNTDHIQPLNARSIADLDNGAFGLEIDRQLRMLARDIVDRPTDVMGKATPGRKLKLAFDLTPIVEFDQQQGISVLTGISVEPSIDGTMPKVSGGKTESRINSDGGLVFNKAIPAKFDQRPLFPETEEAADENEAA